MTKRSKDEKAGDSAAEVVGQADAMSQAFEQFGKDAGFVACLTLASWAAIAVYPLGLSFGVRVDLAIYLGCGLAVFAFLAACAITWMLAFRWLRPSERAGGVRTSHANAGWGPSTWVAVALTLVQLGLVPLVLVETFWEGEPRRLLPPVGASAR